MERPAAVVLELECPTDGKNGALIWNFAFGIRSRQSHAIGIMHGRSQNYCRPENRTRTLKLASKSCCLLVYFYDPTARNAGP